MRPPVRHRRLPAADIGLLLVLALLLAGCAAGPVPVAAPAVTGDPALPAAVPTVPDPGPLTGPPVSTGAVVQVPRGAGAVRRAVERIPGVRATVTLATFQVAVGEQVVTVGAVDPAAYRRFTPPSTARADRVWARVAAGELAIDPRLRRLEERDAMVRLGNGESDPTLHVGARAAQAPLVDLVVNRGWGEALGAGPDNTLLVAATPDAALLRRIRTVVGARGTVQSVGSTRLPAVRSARLVGPVGTQVTGFRYRDLGGGRIAPDPAWVRASIRTEEVPLLGRITCHRALFRQLRTALREVEQAGLAGAIHPQEYGGCYVPRYIAGTRQLSMHAFGIAIDLNVPGNGRGTAGEIDRRVVAILRRWGFAWGGDWSWTDPMHFEAHTIVR